METKDAALLGFVSAAEKFVDKHLTDGTDLGELKDINIGKLKNELSDELKSLGLTEKYKNELKEAGEKAFADYAEEHFGVKKSSVLDELGEIFSFKDSEDKKENKEYKEETIEESFEDTSKKINALLDAYDYNDESEEEDLIAKPSEDLGEIFNEVLEHENIEQDDNEVDEFGLTKDDDVFLRIANAAAKSDEELAKTFAEEAIQEDVSAQNHDQQEETVEIESQQNENEEESDQQIEDVFTEDIAEQDVQENNIDTNDILEAQPFIEEEIEEENEVQSLTEDESKINETNLENVEDLADNNSIEKQQESLEEVPSSNEQQDYQQETQKEDTQTSSNQIDDENVDEELIEAVEIVNTNIFASELNEDETSTNNEIEDLKDVENSQEENDLNDVVDTISLSEEKNIREEVIDKEINNEKLENNVFKDDQENSEETISELTAVEQANENEDVVASNDKDVENNISKDDQEKDEETINKMTPVEQANDSEDTITTLEEENDGIQDNEINEFYDVNVEETNVDKKIEYDSSRVPLSVELRRLKSEDVPEIPTDIVEPVQEEVETEEKEDIITPVSIFDLNPFGSNGGTFVPPVEETIKEPVKTDIPVNFGYIVNPVLDIVLEQEKEANENFYSNDIAQEDKKDEFDDLKAKKYLEKLVTNPGFAEPQEKSKTLSSIIAGLDNLRKRQEDKKVLEEEYKQNEEIYEDIMSAYPYLEKSFIKAVYSQKEDIENEYVEDGSYILLHRLLFSDLDELHEFVEIMMAHGYAVNVDEKQMIVDTFREIVNEDGIIIANILGIANQAMILNGKYDGYCVLDRDRILYS